MRAAVIEPTSSVVTVMEMPEDRLAWFHEVVGVDEIDFTTLGRFRTGEPDEIRVHMVSDDLATMRIVRPARNAIATRLYNPDPDLMRQAGQDPWPILGNVVLTAYDETGETVDLPFAVLDAIRALGITVEVRP